MNDQKWAKSVGPILTLLLLAGCHQEQSAQPAPPEVATVIVKPQNITLTTELPGRTSAYRFAEIRPQVSGLLQKRLFTEGADVQSGQLLYQIDPAPFQAALDSALANLIAAEKSVDRAKAALVASNAGVERADASLTLAKINRDRIVALFAENAVSAAQRDQAVTDYDVAQASLHAAHAQVSSDQQAVATAEAAVKQAQAATETARINLNYTKITAPIAGRIGRSAVTDGAIVTAYQSVELAVIQQLDPIYVDVPQSTGELLQLQNRLKDGRLKHGGDDQNQVELLLEDNSKYALNGTLEFREVTVDPTTGSVVLRMVFPNPETTLLPGMFTRALVKEGIKEQAILVPQQAVSRDTKGNPIALLVNSESKVVRRGLKVDRAIGDQWLVISGIEPGDHVIVEGLQRARAGATVHEVAAKNAHSKPATAGAGVFSTTQIEK